MANGTNKGTSSVNGKGYSVDVDENDQAKDQITAESKGGEKLAKNNDLEEGTSLWISYLFSG